jgi:poly-D-alanine transfer protein DltD
MSDLTKVSNQSITDPDGIHISCKIWTAETEHLNKHLTVHFYVDEAKNVVTHATYVVHDDR